jgi:Secretion system C-terminal sorting domain/Right handed beta helix region
MKKIIYSLLFISFASFTTNAQTQIYVSTTGNDIATAGAAATPVKTIIYAVSRVASGGTIFVSGGTYNEVAEIYIGKPLTLKRNGAIEVIVDATSRGTASNKYMIGIVNTSNVTVEGITFANNIGNGGKGAWVLGNNNTSNMNNIVIKNCSFENIGWISNNLSAKPFDNTIACNAVKVEGQKSFAITNFTFLNNNVENCATGWGEAVTITGNVNGFTIQGNFVYDIANIGIDVAGNYTNTGAPSAVNQARNGKIIGNEVYDCMSRIANSSGIYLDGALNCTVEKNEVYNCGVGISVGGEQPIGAGAAIPGGHLVKNNLIYNNVITGAYIGTNVSGNAIVNTKIFNNTFYKNRTGAVVNGVDSVGTETVAQAASIFGGEVQLQNSNGVTFKNNILYATNGKKAMVALFGFTITNFVSNYNDFYRDVNTDFIIDLTGISFNGNTTTGSYNRVQFATQTGQDVNSISLLPGFVNVGGNDFALTSTAAAKNKGDVTYNTINSGTTDFGYQTRRRDGRVDIGCFEFQIGTSGKAAPSTATDAEEILTIPSFSIYPNPTKDFVNINFGKNVKQTTITILDMNGKVLLNKMVNNIYFDKINIANLKTASQMVMIKITEGGNVSVNKLMIQ